MLIADPVTRMAVMIALLFLLGRLGEYIFSKSGIPDMIWLVLAGIIVGPVFNILPSNALEPVLPFFGAFALIIILAGGGLSLNIKEVVKAAPRSAALAVSGFILALVGTFIFGQIMTFFGIFPKVGTMEWIMIGSMLGGTSALVVMPAMAMGGVSKPAARLLEVESCMTDALCVIVAMVIVEMLVGGEVNLSSPTLDLIWQVGMGVLIGAAGATALLPMLTRLAGKPEHYTVMLSGFFILYGAVQICGGNGALGVMTCALILGNAHEILGKYKFAQHAPSLKEDSMMMTIHGHIAFFIKSFFFFFIGLMFPTSPKLILSGAGLALFLGLFRIPAVMLSLRGTDFKPADQRLIMTSMPRGLAAVVLSTVPMQMGMTKLDQLTPGIFSAIVFTIVIFAIGFAVVKRMQPAGAESPETGREEELQEMNQEMLEP